MATTAGQLVLCPAALHPSCSFANSRSPNSATFSARTNSWCNRPSQKLHSSLGSICGAPLQLYRRCSVEVSFSSKSPLLHGDTGVYISRLSPGIRSAVGGERSSRGSGRTSPPRDDWDTSYQDRYAHDEESGYRNQGRRSPSDSRSSYGNQGRSFPERGGNDAYRPGQRSAPDGNGERGEGRAAFSRAPGGFSDDRESGRFNAAARRPGSFGRERTAQFERRPQSSQFARFDDISDDDEVQTRSFERGGPRVTSAPPRDRREAPGLPPDEAPFRRIKLDKRLFEQQGKQLAGNLGIDERDLRTLKQSDLRDSDVYDVGKRPDFRDFAQRDIFKDRIGQSSAAQPEPPVRTAPRRENFQREYPQRASSQRNFPPRESTRFGPPQYGDRNDTLPKERGAPGDFQNQAVKPFEKPKPPGLDVGPTLESIKPRFVPREDPPETNHLGWKPENNRGYRPPRAPRNTYSGGYDSAPVATPERETEFDWGYNSAPQATPQQWLRKPPMPPVRYRPVASDGEIKFEQDRGEKYNRKETGLEQEEDEFWDEEQDSEEMSFARAALSHDLELEDLEEAQYQMQEEERAEKLRRRRMMYRAESILDAEELKRLRRDCLRQRWFLKIGKTGVTSGLVTEIFKVWENLEVAKVKVREGALLGQMRHIHTILEEKTGGLVILRTGTLIHLYRGPDYTGPPTREKINDITEAIGDRDMFGESDDLEEGDLMEQFEVEDGISSVARFLLRDQTEDVPKFARKLAVMAGGEKGNVRKRLAEKPVRWLPPGQSAKLTNFEMMMLRRKGKRIKPAFVLGQQRRFDGLAAAIMEYWERNEIVKISMRAVINANLERTAKQIQDLIGGVLLVKEGGLISLYRGKDYLPLRIGEALRRYQQRMVADKAAERAAEAENTDSGGEETSDEKGGAMWVAEAGVSEQEFEQELEEDEKVAQEELKTAGELEAIEVLTEEGVSGTVSGSVSGSVRGTVRETVSDGVSGAVDGAVSEPVSGAVNESRGESSGGEVSSLLEEALRDEEASSTPSESDALTAVHSDEEGASVEPSTGRSDAASSLSERTVGVLRSPDVEGSTPSAAVLDGESEGLGSGTLGLGAETVGLEAESAGPAAEKVGLGVGKEGQNAEKGGWDAEKEGLDGGSLDSDAGSVSSDTENVLSDAESAASDGKSAESDAEEELQVPKLVKDLVVLEDEVPQARIDQMLEAVAAYRRRDIETLTPQERAALRKKGLGEKRYLQVGRRGVFAGTIQNIHLHWKRHELCKVKCTGIRVEIVPIVAEQLAVESGGVLVDYVGTTILLYRGKNYIAPETIVPVHMLNKQEALRRAKAEQRAQSLLDLEIQRQEELAKQRKRLEYSLKLEQQAQEPKKRKEWPLAPGVREYVVIPEAVELNTTVEVELRKAGPLIPKEHNMPDLPAFWRAPDMSPVQKKKIAGQAKQERTHAFLVGKRGITEGLGLTIRQHFYKHAFAKVSLKQRPSGITVKECMIELERLTGGVCVAKEPTRVIIYRGWPPGTDPPWIKKDPETGEVVSPPRPLITQVLREAEEAAAASSDDFIQDLDDSVQDSDDFVQDSDTSGKERRGESRKNDGTNVFGEHDDFTRAADSDWESEDDGEIGSGEGSDDEETFPLEEEAKDGRENDGNGYVDLDAEVPSVLYMDSKGVGHASVKAL